MIKTMKTPHLVYSSDVFNPQRIVAALHTGKAQPITAYNEPYEDSEASLLYAVAADLEIPIVKTHQSRAFCLDVERLLAYRLSRETGVEASYFSHYA